jgi:hypothetical protein
VTQLEWLVLCALERFSWSGKDPCYATNLQIADAIGLTGSGDTRKRMVRIALHGRTYRKGRWDPETGKWKRDGEEVKIPGLCDPSRGFVEVRKVDDSAPRELVLTSRWLKWGRVRLLNEGNGGPREAGPRDGQGSVPAVAEVSTAPPAGNVTTAPASPPPPVASETVEPETAPAIAEPAIGAPTGGPAPAPAEQPSPEVLAEVLGRYASFDRAHSAEWLLGKLGQRGVRLKRCGDGKVRPLPSPGVEAPTENETAVLRWLKPEVVAVLEAKEEKSKPPPEAGEPRGSERAAPRVAEPAEIRRMIAKLTSQPADDDSDCRALTLQLVNDPSFRHNDADPATSEATYFGLARDTKRGELPQAIMTEAFEVACKPKVRNRGAMFVAEVKRLKAGLRKPDGEGSSTS